MSMKSNSDKVVLINPFDIKGGASMGTFRLYENLKLYSSLDPYLFVVSKASSDDERVYQLSLVPRFIFFVQLFINKFFCFILSNQRLPVAFSFFSVVSIPALLICLKTIFFKTFYFHSLGTFACPLSFYFFTRRANVIKTADDWYLTGGCHYSLDCDQWMSGCHSCPHMNILGKAVVRFNWLVKNSMISSSAFVFVSPSFWLADRYETRFPNRCYTIYNSANIDSKHLLDPVHNKSLFTGLSEISLGLPVTYLRDSRKGFLDAIPVLETILKKYPVRLVLCGGDSSEFKRLLLSKADGFCFDSLILDLGQLQRHNMYKFYQELDFVLHFASFDNSPNVITESFANGIPAIVLDRAGSPEHVRSSGAGFIIDEISDLDSTISSLLADLSILKSTKIRASRYSSTVLSSEKMARAYTELLRCSCFAMDKSFT